MRRTINGVLSFYLFAAICLIFLAISGRKAYGLDALPPPVMEMPLPPPVVSSPSLDSRSSEYRPLGTREYWPGFGWVEWKVDGWHKIESGVVEVTQSSPFAYSSQYSTQATTAQTVTTSLLPARELGLFEVPTRTGRTRILARGVVPLGVINGCANGQCPNGR